MSWRDRITQSTEPNDWRSRIAPLTSSRETERPAPEVIYAPEERKLEAAAVGLGRGLTLDMLDELKAAGKASLSPGEWQKLYNQYLEEERQYQKSLEEQHPVITTAGQIGGYAVPGISALKATKAATLGGRALTEAGLGALQGYGAAETEEEKLPLMGLGTVAGGVGSAGLELAGKAARYGMSKAGDVIGTTVFNTPAEVSQALRFNPEALKGAKETGEIADILASKANEMRTGLSSQRQKALDTLADKPLKGKQELISKLEEIPSQFSVSEATQNYPGSQAIINEVNLARDALARSRSQADIKGILARLDEKADFQTASGSQINAVRKQLRGMIDQQLKKENPDYRSAMKEVSQTTRTFKKGQKEARLERGERGELEATDRTTQRLETLLNTIGKSKNEIARTDLENVYPGVIDELRKQRLLRQSQGGTTTGSRNVLLGGASGSLVDILGGTSGIGASGGLLLGAAIDRYGRTLGSAVAKNAGRAGRFLDKYGDYFKGAANKEAVHMFLESADPEYSAMFQELENQ